MHPSIKSYLKRFAIVAGFATALGIGALFKDAVDKNNALREAVAKQSKTIEQKDKEITQAAQKVSDLQAQLATSSRQFSTDSERLKAAVDAFAKQAGACESLRQKLHIQGYSS